jgi:hypothetical protein
MRGFPFLCCAADTIKTLALSETMLAVSLSMRFEMRSREQDCGGPKAPLVQEEEKFQRSRCRHGQVVLSS